MGLSTNAIRIAIPCYFVRNLILPSNTATLLAEMLEGTYEQLTRATLVTVTVVVVVVVVTINSPFPPSRKPSASTTVSAVVETGTCKVFDAVSVGGVTNFSSTPVLLDATFINFHNWVG